MGGHKAFRLRVIFGYGPENLRLNQIVLCPHHRQQLDARLEPSQIIYAEFETYEKCSVCAAEEERRENGWMALPSASDMQVPKSDCKKCVMKPNNFPIGAEMTCNACNVKWIRRTRTVQQVEENGGWKDIGQVTDWEKVS